MNNLLKSEKKDFTRSDGTTCTVVTQAIPATRLVGIFKLLREDPYEPKSLKELLCNTYIDTMNCKDKFDDVFTGDMVMLDEVVEFVTEFNYPVKKKATIEE